MLDLNEGLSLEYGAQFRLASTQNKSQLANETNYLPAAFVAGCFLCASSVHGQTNSQDVEARVNAILDQMTLEEKLEYIGGETHLVHQTDPTPSGFPRSMAQSQRQNDKLHVTSIEMLDNVPKNQGLGFTLILES